MPDFHSYLLNSSFRKQHTLADEVSFSGIGIHTGQCVHMRFIPAEVNSGIVFRRTDIPNALDIPAKLEYVLDTSRSTTIGIGNIRIHTVEHVLAALKAYQVDNLIVEVSNLEPPVGSGGSAEFVDMIEQVGVVEQMGTVRCVKLNSPIYWSEGDIHLVALPSETYQISYTLSYPNTEALKSQFGSFIINSETFKRELAPCRTFSLYSEVSLLMDRGLIKGGSLDNAVVIKDNAVFSKGGLYFDDEMVRHKMLDVVGDLSLIDFDLVAHIISIKSGHASNYAFAKKIVQEVTHSECNVGN